MQRIKKRQELFDKINQNPKKPSCSETPALLARITNEAKADLRNTSLKKGSGPRFCFHPNGNIVFVKGSNLHIIKTTQPKDKLTFTDLIITHKQVSKDDELGLQFERMGFTPSLAQANEANRFNDSFFQNLMST